MWSECYQKYFIILSKGSPFRANTISHQYNVPTKAYFQYWWDCFIYFLANTRYYIVESPIRMLSVWMPLLFVVTRYGIVTVQRKLNTPGVISLYYKNNSSFPTRAESISYAGCIQLFHDIIEGHPSTWQYNITANAYFQYKRHCFFCFVFSYKFCKYTVAYLIKSLIRMRSVWLPLVFTKYVEVIVQREISTPRDISLYYNATPLSQLDESQYITWDKSSHNYLLHYRGIHFFVFIKYHSKRIFSISMRLSCHITSRKCTVL